jgi:hypothetical protein|tara:strand:+ start:866 stop:1036 length:171 start_codon:yes stop_codon:yes gene_type:complete
LSISWILREIHEVFGGGKIIFQAKEGVDLDGDSFYSTYTRLIIELEKRLDSLTGSR